MSKSPINFFGGNLNNQGGNLASLMARGGRKKTARSLKKIDKRLSGIEEKLNAASSQEGAVPDMDASMEAVDETPIADTPATEGIEPVPGAVDALEEDSFATAGDSGLNMIKRRFSNGSRI